jgi:hypothetical protein
MPKSKWVVEQEVKRAKAAELRRKIDQIVDARDEKLDALELQFDERLQALYQEDVPLEERVADANRMVEAFGQDYRSAWDTVDPELSILREKLNG